MSNLFFDKKELDARYELLFGIFFLTAEASHKIYIEQQKLKRKAAFINLQKRINKQIQESEAQCFEGLKAHYEEHGNFDTISYWYRGCGILVRHADVTKEELNELKNIYELSHVCIKKDKDEYNSVSGYIQPKHFMQRNVLNN